MVAGFTSLIAHIRHDQTALRERISINIVMENEKLKTNRERFLDAFRSSDICKKLRDKDDFETVATVNLYELDILNQATAYILSNEVTGKARRRVINPENHFIFEFENVFDAIVFRLRF